MLGNYVNRNTIWIFIAIQHRLIAQIYYKFLLIIVLKKELNINNNKTEKFLLTKENKQQDNYKIEILLNKKISEDILQNVEIKVYSEQKNKEEVKEWKEK